MAAGAFACATACAPLATAPQPSAERHAAPTAELYYHIFVRSFRDSDGDRQGDLQGIREQLDYLESLGVTTLLLTPLYPSSVYHNYFADDFEGVDAEFGDMSDLAALVADVHARGMRIALDQEIHYVTRAHPWFADSFENPQSPFSDFILYNGPDNTEPESGFLGIVELPTWDGQMIGHHTVNLHSPDVQAYFKDFFASWIDPNGDGDPSDGVDGFRIDHMMDDLDAKGVLPDLFERFWAAQFDHMRALNPDVQIIGEQADWGYGEDFLTRGGVDTVFAFPIRQAIVERDKAALVTAITQTARVASARRSQLVFIENHDVDRFANGDRDVDAVLKLGAALNLLVGWTPIIYYGQELGMSGAKTEVYGTDANDIPLREAFPWRIDRDAPGSAIWYQADAPYWTHPANAPGEGVSLEEQEGDPTSLLSFYRSLSAVRQAHPAVAAGTVEVIPTENDVLVLRRVRGASEVIVAANETRRRPSPWELTPPLQAHPL